MDERAIANARSHNNQLRNLPEVLLRTARHQDLTEELHAKVLSCKDENNHEEYPHGLTKNMIYHMTV